MTVDPAVAKLIREVLAEELARLRAGRREEWVRIADDADLAAFARQVLAMGEDRGARDAFESGGLVFRLGQGAGDSAGSAGAGGGRVPGGREDATPAASPPRTAPGGDPEGGVKTLDGGLLSERQVASLPRGTSRVRLGRDVRMTPLARDRLRRRGITIERTES